MIKVTLDHGSTITLSEGATAAQALEALGLAKDAPVVAARIDGDLADLSRPLAADSPSPRSGWTAPGSGDHAPFRRPPDG